MAEAKTKASSTDVIAVEFLRTGNPWIDAGIVGLYRVLRQKPPYLVSTKPTTDVNRFPQVKSDDLQKDRLILRGPADQVQSCLEWAYDQLIVGYFNVSTKKQETERGAWNFYYDSKRDEFQDFPKKKAVGAASLLFDKAPRPSGEQVPGAIAKLGTRHRGFSRRRTPISNRDSTSSLPPRG